ncbi:MAG: hypothetical protein ABR498_02295 [Candidatus Dormibacteria bacterium]
MGGRTTRTLCAAGGALTIAAAGTIAGPRSAGAAAPTYSINKVGAYGGEPSLTAGPLTPTIGTPGELYEASLQAAKAYRSSTQGTSWVGGATNAYSNTGDDCLSTDQSGALYLCNLTITGPQNSPLNGDVYKSVDQGDHWTHSTGVMFGTNTMCTLQSSSCNPFGVDRDWVDAWIPNTLPAAQQDTNHAEVALMYHDFYGPSHIWVNISNDGGANFGGAIDVLSHLNPSAGAAGALALADTACSTVPSNVKIAKGGPHQGRIYVAWIAADPSSFGTGCNLSQAQAFHNLFVAWSDDGGNTWTPQLAYDAGVFHDSSTPFVGFTIDNQGNPYFGFDVENPNYSPATCAVPNNPQTANCEYDMYVVWSKDGGPTWDGGGVTTPGETGAALTALRVNTDTGTHFFPAIDALNPGQVAVAYLETSDIIPTDASGKQHPGGCFSTTGTCTSTDQWYLHGAVSSDLLNTNGSVNLAPHWDQTQITPSPMHQGDICNLGIACPPTANRHLADFIQTAIDPVTGCQHIAYADDKTTNELDSANQTSGCLATVAADTPEMPLVALGPAVAAAALVGWRLRRRRLGTDLTS